MGIEQSVFISYRRVNSYQALAVYQFLNGLGYDVFYDLDSIRAGDWKQIILDNIRARAHFLIVLTPSAVERFLEPDDIMRLEIETAIAQKRSIIPLFFDDFDFASVANYLTGSLAALPQYNGLTVPTRFFRYAMQELHEKYLQQDVDTILHPLSPAAQDYARESQRVVASENTVTEQQLSASQYEQRARKQVNAGEFDAAIASASAALKLNPNYEYAYLRRGQAHFGRGDVDAAIADYSEALRLDPRFIHAYNYRATAYRDGKQDYDRAIADQNEAIRLNPEDFRSYHERGMSYERKAEYDLAIVDFTRGIRINGNHANGYHLRGGAYYHKGDFKRAIADYNRAMRLNPKSAVAYNNRAEVYFALQKYNDALSDFHEALNLRPVFPIATAGQAITHHALGDVRIALELWRVLLKDEPRFADANWIGQEFDWRPELVDEARKIIALL